MALSTAFYNTFVKRNSVYVTSIFVGAFAFGVGFDVAGPSFGTIGTAGNNGRIFDINMFRRETRSENPTTVLDCRSLLANYNIHSR